MWMLGNHPKSSLSVQVDFLNLCKHNVRNIEDLVNGGNLLNQRQCQDLSSKLSKITLNIREVVSQCGASDVFFRPALENLYRYLEKAKVLVHMCGEEDWCAAAVFQIQNENAFREILLDLGLCYNAIYEQAKSTSEAWNVHLEDLRLSSMFQPAMDNDILEDKQDLQKRLEDVANESKKIKLLGHFLPRKQALKQCLAKYLLVKMYFTSIIAPQANSLDTNSAILWAKEFEPSRKHWGNYKLIGTGSGASGVCSTKWLGIPCAKKEFHTQEAEGFFLKEAGILAHLNHPCIINFICCANGQERGDRFIAMELMEKSLSDLIKDQKDTYFSLPIVVDIIVQIARGMCYLHDRGVAHRDLKPQNVVVNRLTSPHLVNHFCVKLVDFGMSKTKVQVSKSSTISSHGVGTTRYRAPEVHPKAHHDGKGKAIWFKADVFSFAMTCSHLLSLKTPFEDMEQLDELYNELLNGRRPELPSNYPPELVWLLKDCWNTNLCSRPSFMEICTRLETLRHKILRGFYTSHQGLQDKNMDVIRGFDFIKTKIEEQSSLSRPFVDIIDDEVEIEMHDSHGNNKNEVVSVIPCTCNNALKLLPQPPYNNGLRFSCNICKEEVDGEVYHCGMCNFVAHLECAEIKDAVKVFFHDDPLHLLVQNHYDDNPNAICRFCEESVQESEWVYRCDQCDFDVHALCTKYSKKMKHLLHSHPLILIHYPLRKSMFSTCCNGDLKGFRYTCTEKWCAFNVHPYCAIVAMYPLCVFDKSHRLSLDCMPKSFHCSRCGTLGFSWMYHCEHCNVDIHVDCVDDTEEEEDGWNEAYEKFMHEYGTKDNHNKIDMISKMVDILPINNALDTSSSSSLRTPLVAMRMQPSIQRLTLMEGPGSDAFNDVNVRQKIATETVERKAKKMARRQKPKAKLFENLKKIFLDLQISNNLSQADVEVLATAHKKLQKRQYIVEEKKTIEVQSKIHKGPRTCLFFKWKLDSKPKKILTILKADMEAVRLVLLCEESGHEHIVHNGQGGVFNGVLGERLKKLQPLLDASLEVVTRAMSMATHLTDFASVTLPCLGTESWDLRAIDLEKHGKRCGKPLEDKENVDSAAEWLLSHVEHHGFNMFKLFGLLRVRYIVSEEGNFPRYTQGTFAWLCIDHLNHGLEAGVLESYPLRMFHNLAIDQQHQYV